jgi:hypothetical protein
MIFLAANMNSWQKLDSKVRDFLQNEFAELENRQWAQAKADVQDGINCNTGKQPCKDGIPANPAMTLATPSETDRATAQSILRERVLANWAKRCGDACAKDWSETVGKVVGVEAKPR